MSMREPLRDVEVAVASLRRATAGATGWSDEQRDRFDRQRIEPLLRLGDQLVHALRRADESVAAAQAALRNEP